MCLWVSEEDEGNGFTVATCNVIFWRVVMPILMGTGPDGNLPRRGPTKSVTYVYQYGDLCVPGRRFSALPNCQLR